MGKEWELGKETWEMIYHFPPRRFRFPLISLFPFTLSSR